MVDSDVQKSIDNLTKAILILCRIKLVIGVNYDDLSVSDLLYMGNCHEQIDKLIGKIEDL